MYGFGDPTSIRIGQQVLSIASTSSYSYTAGFAQYQWNATAISFPGLTTGTLVKVSIFNSIYAYLIVYIPTPTVMSAIPKIKNFQNTFLHSCY